MSNWWPSGRYSPFAFYNQRGPPKVTEDDFSYLSGDEDRHHHHHGSQHSSHHHDGDYGFSRHTSRADSSELDPDVLNLKHKGTTYPLHFPAFAISESLKVGDLRRKAAKETHCDDPRRVRLLYKGRSLRNDDKHCREEGLKQNSELICVVSSDTPGRNHDDGNESSSSASSAAIANGVELNTADNSSDRESRTTSKRKNHRGGAKRRNREISNKDPPPPPRSEEPYRDAGSSYLHPSATSSFASGTTGAGRSDYRAPSPMRHTSSSAPSAASAPASTKAPTTPLEIIEALSHTLHTDFLPKVQALLADPPPDSKTRQYECKKWSETILAQVVLKLDGVQVEDEAIKARRKECVKEANKWLTELDRLEKK